MSNPLRAVLDGGPMMQRGRSGCEKVRYPSRAAAWEALDRIDAQGRPVGSKKETTAYRCWRCKGWHTPSQVRRRWTGRATG